MCIARTDKRVGGLRTSVLLQCTHAAQSSARADWGLMTLGTVGVWRKRADIYMSTPVLLLPPAARTLTDAPSRSSRLVIGDPLRRVVERP